MARKECAIDKHVWQPRKRGKPGEEECKTCETRFPCAEKNCGHFDCIGFRRSTGSNPACYYCEKNIAGSYESFGARGNTKAAHPDCRTPHIAQEQADRERQARMAQGDFRPEDIEVAS